MRRSHRRSTKVCTRCRKRKTKCDFKFPSCTPCEAAGASCLGFDPLTREAVPRSLVKSLEDRVAELETQLLTIQERPDTIPFSMASIISQATVSSGVASSKLHLGHDISYRLLLRPSCPPLAVVRQGHSVTANASPSPPISKLVELNAVNPYSAKSFIDLRTVPFTAIARMVQNYAEILRPQYPCITETMLLNIFELTKQKYVSRTDSTPLHEKSPDISLGHFEYFVLFIVLAISSMTLTWKDENQARTASEAFFHSALRHFHSIECQSEIQVLQITLLLAHYALMCPEKMDIWTCVSKAVRNVLSLGLYALQTEDLQPDQATMWTDLFWVTYGMERSMCVNLRLPLSFPEECVITKISTPSVEDEFDPSQLINTGKKPSSQHICLYRGMETEVHRVLHLEEDLSKFTGTTIEEWIADLTNRLTIWYEQSQVYAQFNMLEFRVVQLYHLKARMHRPTPRLRSRTDDDRRIVLESARILIDDYLTQSQRRRLFYPWHGVHILFEAAVISLDACWSMIDWQSMSTEILHMLSQSIPQCLQLLSSIGQRWHEAVTCVDRLRPLVSKVADAFEERIMLTSFPTYDAKAISGEINGLVFSDGPLIWDQEPQGNWASTFDDWSPLQNHALYDSMDLFEWNPEWGIMPPEAI